MRNKKNFNNLFDSICISLLFLFCLILYSIVLYSCVINNNYGSSIIYKIIISTILFGFMILTSIVLIVKGCYEYWILFDDALVSKKIFCKRTEIKLTEIQKVEKKIVPALVLGIYKSEAYIIYSKNEKIIILIDNKKNYSDLNFELTKFINIARKEGKYYNG